MGMLDDLSTHVAYIAKNADKMWSFAWNTEGSRAESCTKSHIQMWNDNEEISIAFKMAVKTTVMALGTFVFAHIVAAPVIIKALLTVGLATITHVSQHYHFEHDNCYKASLKVKEMAEQAKEEASKGIQKVKDGVKKLVS